MSKYSIIIKFFNKKINKFFVNNDLHYYFNEKY